MNYKNQTAKTILFASLIVAMILPFSGMGNSFAQQTPGEEDKIEAPYTLKEIEHSFAVMENYVIYDENKNITFDIINATRDNISQNDINIAQDFAVYSDNIINAAIGPTGQVNEDNTDKQELKQKIQELEEGKFQALFGANIEPTVSVNEITFTDYQYDSIPILTAFGISEYADIYQIRHNSNNNSLLACGGNYQNPHPADSNPTIVNGFTSLYSAQQDLYQNGYHIVPSYASWGDESGPDIGFAKFVTSGAPGNCNTGQFRDEGVINQYTYASYTVYENEPNPEVISYWWPKIWWGTYVEWWHDNF